MDFWLNIDGKIYEFGFLVLFWTYSFLGGFWSNFCDILVILVILMISLTSELSLDIRDF